MAWQYTPFALLYTGVAVVVAGLGAWVYHNRMSAGSGPLTGLLAATSFWTLCAGLELARTDAFGQRLFGNATYLAIATLPVVFLYFAESYSGHETPLTRYGLGPLFIVPAITQLFIWTNPLHHLMWQRSQLFQAGAVPTPSMLTGGWFVVHTLYSYALLVVGSYLLVRMLVVSENVYRGQAVAILVGTFTPWVANALYLGNVVSFPFDPTPAAFSVTAAAFVLAIYRHRLLEMVPVAREVARDELMDNLVEAVFVLDDDRRIIDYNQRAARIVDDGDASLVGRPVAEACPELEAVIAEAADADSGTQAVSTELALRRDGKLRYYDVQVTALRRAGGLLTGHLVSLRDVTDQRQREQRLNVLNRALRHDLRNEANVVLGYAELGKQNNPEAEWVDAIESHISGLIDLSEKARQLEQALDSDHVDTHRLDAVDVIETVVAEYEADRPDVSIETDLPETAHVSAIEFFADAVGNAVENAIEHNDNPEPLIEVAVSAWVEDDEVAIEILDNGPGIHEEERAVLLRGRETQLQHISGLGLWIINWIVTESGGTVQFQENDPRGSIVTIRLPMAEGEPDEQEAGEAVSNEVAESDVDAEDAEPAVESRAQDAHS
ncbi:PAS domain S-box-containing protein [Halorientalis persicus]|jgi:PAS domain S-box-containing protein|uniref:histidine kinase n=1 Tax=Halorientalis persicus TaxID=1367881 RepID=A0A1H8PPC7_9EURY|nr:histidine kinase N-terminal 7TM domain-containing protein [Halorientalis persicus]SEO43889.1 PAS domain S-box-containing protein [Halorientalis persicus]